MVEVDIDVYDIDSFIVEVDWDGEGSYEDLFVVCFVEIGFEDGFVVGIVGEEVVIVFVGGGVVVEGFE